MGTLANEPLYERDFYAWALEQAALLRAGQLASADIENIAEEIESMGRSENRELISRLAVLLAHLLKWQFQPGYRGRSWQLTIMEQRKKLARHMKDNPSLKARLDEAIADGYELAAFEAERETGLDPQTFPAMCPYTYAQMLDDDFWPEG